MLDPTNLDTGDELIVSDNDSRYDGTEGRATAIYDDRVVLEVSGDSQWSLTLSFDLDQLKRP